MIKREDVAVEQTWNIDDLYASENDFEDAKKKLSQDVEDFKLKYEGNIKSANQVNAGYDDLKGIYEQALRIGNYAMLQVEADMLSQENNERNQSTNMLSANVMSKLTFFESEVLELDLDILKEAAKNEENKRSIEMLIKKKPYVLSRDKEETLSVLDNTLSYPYQGYNDTKFKDIRFPDVKLNGKSYPMTYNSFEGHMEYEQDIDLRREAFKVFSETLRQYENTTASLYNAQVQKEKTISDMRGFDNVFDYLLFDQEVDINLYNRQIDVIMKELSPHMRKYAGLIGKIHSIDQVRYSDLKIELDPEYSPELTIDDARKYVVDGLSILGEDYQDILNRAFDERWIDYSENLGKRTGAFCSSVYGVHPYVMLSFNGKMSEVMTLAHELGHAGHSYLDSQEQNILNTRSSRYFVEAPSTTNELIVENYLLDQAEENQDKRMERWILSQMISKTYYHNFVTHFMEAAFQREVYKLVEEKKSLDAKKLNTIFKSKLEEFWGDSVLLDEGAELTWMRQPHYYMGLYSYTYSAGLTIGTQLAKNIRENGKNAAANWIEVLKAGGSKTPMELAKMAGVDISTDKPLKDTIKYIGEIIDRIEELSIELGDI